MKGRTVIGCALAAAGTVCCLLSLTGAPRRTADVYAASGRSAAFSRPEMPGGTVRVNDADAEELTALPGIGETMAKAILAERALHGPFFYPEDLCAVKGIGQATVRKFRTMLDMAE